MSSTRGISGSAVALTTVGGVLVWSAISNRWPVDVIKGVLQLPTSGKAVGPAFGDTTSGIRDVTGADGSAGALGKITSPGDAGTAAGSAAGSAMGAGLVALARKQIGIPYSWAHSDPASGFDCSGLVVYCLRQAGIPDVPRFTTATFGRWAKSRGWQRIAGGFRAGDVILRSGHMAIATGPETMVHAPHPGARVVERSIYQLSSWWGWRA